MLRFALRCGVVVVDEDDTSAEDEEADPLHEAEALVEEGHAKQGGCEQLQLGADLEDGGLEVVDGEVHEVVLNGIEDGRDGRSGDLVVTLLKGTSHDVDSLLDRALLDTDQHEGENQLH